MTGSQASTLFYIKEGQGKKNLLLFHGFGQDHTAFESIRSELSSQYTWYSFDLYFHGKSNWSKGEEPVGKEEWKNILAHVLQENKIGEFSIMSFSIGTKFALCTVEAFPGRIKELFLIAPDGIKTSLWYTLATRFSFSRKLFRRLMENPDSLLHLAQRVGMLRKDVLQFARVQMKSADKRMQIYYSWVVFRCLQVSERKTAELINQFDISVFILLGKRDHIIPEKSLAPFLQRLHRYTKESEDASHHQLLSREMLSKFFLKTQTDLQPKRTAEDA